MSLSADNDSLAHKGLQIIKGLPFSVVFKKEFIEESLDYVPHDDDVIIATYPKTGTTWMQYIVVQILTKGESFPAFKDVIEKIVPFMEMAGTAAVDAITTRPRVYKHHFPYDKVQKNPNAKYIYVYRRPEDTFVSYFHFMSHIVKTLDFEQFFDDFLTGEINYASYFDHVQSYLKHVDDGNILMVSYETLHAHRKEEILRIARFLGDEYHKVLSTDESMLNNIIEKTSFDYMKKNLTVNFDRDPEKGNLPEDIGNVDFFRKGIVGDGKKTLSEDQLRRLRTVIIDKMKGTHILTQWLTE